MDWRSVALVLGGVIGVWVRMEVKLAVVVRDLAWIRAQLTEHGFIMPPDPR